MQAYLRVVSGPDAGRTFDLTEGVKLMIGRGEKSDTRLADATVSRLHCELQWEGARFVLVDLGSVGGTLVDGKKITLHHLKHGEEFQIGATRLALHTTGIADASTLMAAQKPARELKADEEVLTGQTISHFELGQPLARGRTGTIYKARDTRDGKDVAFKVYHADFTSDDEDVQRFIRAMTTVVELHHPNLIALYGAGKRGETCWTAMEYVDGEPLTKLIEKFGTLKMLDWQFALKVGAHVAQALEAAHEKHIIHRNISPESILIRTKDKAAKLGDMMLAKAMDGIKARADHQARGTGGQRGLHGPRADPLRRRGRHPRRHLRPGRDALCPSDRQASLRGQEPGRDDRGDPPGRPGPAQEVPAFDSRPVSGRGDDDAGQAARDAVPDPGGSGPGAGASGQVPGRSSLSDRAPQLQQLPPRDCTAAVSGQKLQEGGRQTTLRMSGLYAVDYSWTGPPRFFSDG